MRALSKPGQALGPDAATATVNNPEWFGRNADGELIARGARRRLHRELITEALAKHSGAQAQGRAIVLAGPPGAGKTTTLKKQLGEDGLAKFVRIDADDFKEALLARAEADGSFEGWIKPQAVKDLEAGGERFFPLELAALVHEESSLLARKARDQIVAAADPDSPGTGLNLVIDTVLSNEASALKMGADLAAAGYSVRVIDVEVPFDVSEDRIRERWRDSYEAALAGGQDQLGGRWVPSEYAREVFTGPGGAALSEGVARRLAQECPAVVGYQLHRVTSDMVTAESPYPTPIVECDMLRAGPGKALLDRRLAEVQRSQSQAFPRGPGRRGPEPDGPGLGD
ncbi:zeta toxin family protein [Nocardioides phosphati]|uniref:zeta toxin family protein n=1 Tax=Nocardioides phosphati TaxID=1867775 RepID=UPI0016698B4B|nr:zeta toxin family protein [Nocardioides phosphati]